MAILSTIIVPHPPLIVPKVGNGQEKLIQNTVDSYHEVAKSVADLAPQTILLFSPHAVAYADYFHIVAGTKIKGDLRQFGDEETVIETSIDEELVEEISQLCEENFFPAGTLGDQAMSMDHGTLVPLTFINQYYTDYQLVICSMSGLSKIEQYRFGMHIAQAIENLSRSTVVIASGDLSHKLKDSGPYNFAEEGPELDRQLTDIMKTGNFMEFLKIDEKLCKLGAECGLGSFIMMSGMLDQKKVTPKFLSYEGPLGVGYAICIFEVEGDDENRNFYDVLIKEKREVIEKLRQSEDEYVKLAREALEQYILTDKLINLPQNLPEEMLNNKAGAFVSIKKEGRLRGCIGTIEPSQENIALEIMYNAISSGTRDSRFQVVRKEELENLVYNVDVLSPEKPVATTEGLDPKRFGIIVTSGNKRGVLLPNLDGVDTVEKQIDIACQKAGILNSEDYRLECFEVVRHT